MITTSGLSLVTTACRAPLFAAVVVTLAPRFGLGLARARASAGQRACAGDLTPALLTRRRRDVRFSALHRRPRILVDVEVFGDERLISSIFSTSAPNA